MTVLETLELAAAQEREVVIQTRDRAVIGTPLRVAETAVLVRPTGRREPIALRLADLVSVSIETAPEEDELEQVDGLAGFLALAWTDHVDPASAPLDFSLRAFLKDLAPRTKQSGEAAEAEPKQTNEADPEDDT